MYSERYSLRGRQAHGRRRARRRASSWAAFVISKMTRKGKGLCGLEPDPTHVRSGLVLTTVMRCSAR